MPDDRNAYARKAIKQRIFEFKRRLAALCAASLDPEDVHQARVASRRLRTALWVFSGLFSETRRRFWKDRISRLAKSLGAARDLDTRIGFVQEIFWAKDIVDRLKKQRLNMQPGLRVAAGRFLKTGALEDIEKALAGSGQWLERRAVRKIGRRLQDFIKRGQGWKGRPACRSGRPACRSGRDWPRLHRLRIAVKRLRYTLEISAPLYGRRLARYINEAVVLQRNLGRLHEFDVWSRDFFRESSGADIEKKLGRLCEDLREKEYKKFLKLREKQGKQKIWESLKRLV